MEPLEQVFKGGNMMGIGIILFIYFCGEKEKVEEHGISYQFCDLEEGPILHFYRGYLPDDLKNDNDDGRP
jgi:hypothetical protein